jgi:hypothetical protein
MARTYVFLCASFAVLLPILSGCSKGPRLIQVKGTVKIDGKGTSGVTMLFHPEDKANPYVSSALSEENGSFTIVTDTNPGIPAGKYKVTATYPDPAHKPSQSEIMQGLAEPGKDMLGGRFASKEKGLVLEVTSSSVDLPALEYKSK